MIITNNVGEKQIIVQLGETLKEIAQQMCELAIENNHGNVSAAARSLGLKRTALSMRLKKYGYSKGNLEEQEFQAESVG